MQVSIIILEDELLFRFLVSLHKSSSNKTLLRIRAGYGCFEFGCSGPPGSQSLSLGLLAHFIFEHV